MKTLYLIRHAKSSWAFDFSDHDRPLGSRGRKDVSKMSEFAAANISKPSLVISSTASRALYTALHYCDSWEYPEEKIISDERLFHASADRILSILKEYDKEASIAIFGHNPGFTDFNNLVSDYMEYIPTCGTVGIRFDIESWRDLAPNTGKQLFFYGPKTI